MWRKLPTYLMLVLIAGNFAAGAWLTLNFESALSEVPSLLWIANGFLLVVLLEVRRLRSCAEEGVKLQRRRHGRQV